MQRVFLLMAFVGALFGAGGAQAQMFRNQGVQFNLGYLGLGTLWDQALGGPAWNMDDQVTLGAGHTLALGYNLWFDNTVAIGGGKIRVSELTDQIEPVFSLSISTGLRYVFLEERLRPFISGNIHYLQIIAVTPNPPVPVNAFLGAAPFWVGARGGGGVEYIFGDEMSVMAELSLVGFFGLNQAPCFGTIRKDNSCDGEQAGQSFVVPASVSRLSYLVYF
jgi:hypothetical protein